MKKVFVILTLIAAIIAGAAPVDAKKTTKKKSSSSSSISFSTFYDGCPSVNGHTYTGTLDGIKFTVKFSNYNGSEGTADASATYRGRTEREINNWYYQGNGVIMFYLNGGNPCYYEIQNGGKSLYSRDLNVTLKAIR